MKDLTKIYIDLSKCTKEQIKALPKIFENSGDKILPETLSDLIRGKITDGFKFLFYSQSGWNQNDYPLNGRTELTYTEFIKLFEGEDGEILSDVVYWQTRCLLAEKCLSESPCDTDVTIEQINAHNSYNEFIETFGNKE